MPSRYIACVMQYSALVLVLFFAPSGVQTVFAQVLLPDNSAPTSDALPEKPVPQHNFLIRPFYDHKIVVLAEVNAGAAVWDDITTRIYLERGGYERNPLIRPFVHNSGTLIAETAAEVWLLAVVADRMKNSNHAALRKAWWLPQALGISARLYGGINNTVLLSR